MSAGNRVQVLWDQFLDKVGDDPYDLYVWGTLVVSWTMYWGLGGMYTLFDITKRPKFLRKYKMQPNTNEPPEWNKFFRAIGILLINMSIVSYLVGYFYYQIFHYFDYQISRRREPLPTLPRAVYDILGMVVVNEITFYYFHRLFHVPFFYKNFHKRHHEWQSPISITAIYAHPFEHAVCNLSTIIWGVLVMDCHILIYLVWVSLSIIVTLNDHSGYHLPFYRSPEFHDYHHLKFSECYGVMGWLDYLHGTSKKYRETQYYKRDKTLLSFTPARVQFPDKKKK